MSQGNDTSIELASKVDDESLQSKDTVTKLAREYSSNAMTTDGTSSKQSVHIKMLNRQ